MRPCIGFYGFQFSPHEPTCKFSDEVGVYTLCQAGSAGRKSQDIPADETRIRVCLVSRDPALIEEVHKHLFIGFSTRGGYDFKSDHPDFQQYCDVLFVDLRAAGVQGDPGSPTRAGSASVGMKGPQEGLAFIDAIRKSVSHPPIVVRVRRRWGRLWPPSDTARRV